MRYFITQAICVALIGLSASVVQAQLSSNSDSSSLPGYGNTGTSSNSSSSSSGSSSSSNSSNSSGSTIGESLGETAASDVDRFQGVAANDFIGINDSAPFVGRERPFETSSSTRTSNVRNSTSTRSASSRTTSSRTSASRTNMSRTSGTSNSTGVRAATTTDFTFSPMEVGHREAAFQSRIQRLPNLRSLPQQIQVKIDQTSTGNIATLKGTVASERERKIAKQLLLLEPGIDKVDNQIIVVSNTTSTTRRSMQSQPDVLPTAYQTPIMAPPRPNRNIAEETDAIDLIPILAPEE